VLLVTWHIENPIMGVHTSWVDPHEDTFKKLLSPFTVIILIILCHIPGIFYNITSSLSIFWQYLKLLALKLTNVTNVSIIYATDFCNPPSANNSCDARIGGCWQNGLVVPHSPFTWHPQSMNTHSLSQWSFSLMHFTQRYPSSYEPFLYQKLEH
jgi:hypothetical protein